MKNTRDKVVDNYRELARTQIQFCPTKMAELGPGIIAVEDRSGECDVLFDPEQWEYKNPKLWTREGHESPTLTKAGLGCLEGIGRLPPVTNIPEMVLFAKDQIAPRGASVWHATPEEFEF